MAYTLIDTHHFQGKSSDHADFFVVVSQNVSDARMLASLSDDSILGVVGVAEFNKTSLKPILEESQGFSKIHVFRHSNPELDERWENGLQLLQKAGFSCELEVKEDQFFELVQICLRNPKINFILSTDGIDRNSLEIKELSKLDNVALKILIPNIEYDASRAWILDAIDLFGTERVMFGMGDKSQFSDISKMTSDFSESEKENLFCNSAKKWYNL